MTSLSIREFARRDGCDERLVRRAVSTGRLPRREDGTLDANLVGTEWRVGNIAGPRPSADIRRNQRRFWCPQCPHCQQMSALPALPAAAVFAASDAKDSEQALADRTGQSTSPVRSDFPPFKE